MAQNNTAPTPTEAGTSGMPNPHAPQGSFDRTQYDGGASQANK